MQLSGDSWQVHVPQPGRQKELAGQLGISPSVAQVLCNRGIQNEKEARKFLYGGWQDLEDPFELPGMEQAVARLIVAIRDKERVMVYGDFDVDGLTSTAIMVEVLSCFGLEVGYYIPNRLSEGYGLNSEAIKTIAAENWDLLVTVDCGISSLAEVAVARSEGLDVIVTDHHEPGFQLPEAAAVVDPKLDKVAAPLAGVGVVFKLIQALNRRLGAGIDLIKLLDLVALGTIADVVDMIGDNRILVKEGLLVLCQNRREGLKSLLEVAGLKVENISSDRLAFTLVPRLNAAGRMGRAEDALELLLTRSDQKAWELARQLDQENSQRQLLEREICDQAIKMVESEVDRKDSSVLVLASEMWHQGVIGIVASRLAQRYQKPVVLIALQGESGKGSGRSVEGFHLFKGFQACAGDLEGFGGHSQAAGLSIKKDKVADFRQNINLWAAACDVVEVSTGPVADVELFLDQLDLNLAKELKILEPFGPGNPVPLFVTRQGRVRDLRLVGKTREHLKFRLAGHDGQGEIEVIGFKKLEMAPVLRGETVDICFSVESNQWQGEETIQLHLKDAKPSGQQSSFYPVKLRDLVYAVQEVELNTWYMSPPNIYKLSSFLEEMQESQKARSLVVCDDIISSFYHYRRLHDCLGNNKVVWWAEPGFSTGSRNSLFSGSQIVLIDYHSLAEIHKLESKKTIAVILGRIPEEHHPLLREFLNIHGCPSIWFSYSGNLAIAQDLQLNPLAWKTADIVDARGREVIDYVLESEAKKKLVVTSNEAEAARLTQVFRQKAGAAEKVGNYHRALTAEQRLLVYFAFKEGPLDLIVTSREFPIDAWADVFLCRVPLTSALFEEYLAARQVHLLFKTQDLQLSKNALGGLYPLRSELALLYKELRARFHSGQSTVALQDLVCSLRHQGWMGVGSFSIWLGVKVFSDVNLVHAELDCQRLTIHDISEKKSDLHNSNQYLENKRKRQETDLFLEAMYCGTEERIRKYLLDGA